MSQATSEGGTNGRAGSPSLERVIAGLVRRARLARGLGAFLRFGALGLALSGCGVLLLRALWQVEPDPRPAFALAPVAALALGILRSRGASFDRRAAAAWLDVELGGSGRFVTGFERPDARWRAELARRLAGPAADGVLRPSLHLGRAALALLGGAAFLAAALWVQVPERRTGPSPELVQALVGGLGDKLDLLRETVALDEALDEDLGERLERLEATALDPLLEEVAPESLLASIDALEERLGAEAQRLGLDLDEAEEALRRTAMDLLADPERAQASVQQALSLLQASGLRFELPPELTRLLGELGDETSGAIGGLDPAKLLRMGMGLSELLEGPRRSLLEGGLLDPSKLRQAVPLAELFGLLRDGHECESGCDVAGNCPLGTRGSGSIARGPGRAPLWGEETPEQREVFAPERLQPAEVLEPDLVETLAEGVSAPEPMFGDESAGRVEVESSSGEAAWRRRLAPRHRDAVRRFFDVGAPDSGAARDADRRAGEDPRR